MKNKFENGDIVYWCHQNGHKYSVHWGMVDEQFSRSVVYVDYLAPRERRLVNGVPIDEFKSEDKYKKLPKGWSYDTKLFEITSEDIDEDIRTYKLDIRNPDSVKKAYDDGLLVKKSTIFDGEIDAEITKDGYRIVKKYPPYRNNITSISIRPDKLYLSYEEAQQEVDKNIAEFIRQSELSDYEWSVEQIDKTLNRCYGKTDIEKKQYRDWLLEMDNVEDIEVRIIGGEIQWKYWNKERWANIEI